MAGRIGQDNFWEDFPIVTASVASVCFVFVLIVVFGGDTTLPIRQVLGISYLMSEEAGVYADCSRSVNRNNRFCRGEGAEILQRNRESQSDFYKRTSKTIPFSLSD